MSGLPIPSLSSGTEIEGLAQPSIALFSNWAMKLTESREYISSVHSYIPAGAVAFDRHSMKIELTDLS